MIKVKHLMDPVEADDGARIWVEPIGLTRDLREWCGVNEMLREVGPPIPLWKWFEENPDEYEIFCTLYYKKLCRPQLLKALQRMAVASLQEDITLLHQGERLQNTATALHDFLIVQLNACAPPDA